LKAPQEQREFKVPPAQKELLAFKAPLGSLELPGQQGLKASLVLQAPLECKELLAPPAPKVPQECKVQLEPLVIKVPLVRKVLRDQQV
jgi:hypothetical protein